MGLFLVLLGRSIVGIQVAGLIPRRVKRLELVATLLWRKDIFGFCVVFFRDSGLEIGGGVGEKRSEAVVI
jgi:hypothetical protein